MSMNCVGRYEAGGQRLEGEYAGMPWYLPDRQPMLWEELRRRMRGGRNFWALLAVGLAVLLPIFGMMVLQPFSGDPRSWPQYGKGLWAAFLVGHLVIMLLVSPALTATAISAERQAQTLELLFLTRLGTLSLVLGKYFGAVGQMVQLAIATLPLIAIVFLFGGVSPVEVAVGYLLILQTGLFYATVGFLASCLFARTATAIVGAYGLLLFVLLGLPLLFIFVEIIGLSLLESNYNYLFAPNPFFTLLMLMNEGGSARDTLSQVLTSAGINLAIIAGMLAFCVYRIHQMRGAHSLLPRRISLEVARFNSRPAGVKW